MTRQLSKLTITLSTALSLYILPTFWRNLPRSYMTTQTALIVRNIGEPVTAVHDWPIPQPGPKQIQVRVTTAGLNPHDQKGRDFGLFIQDDLPAILGSDIVGVVTTRGEGASRFNIGDRVFGQASMASGSVSKALQQYAVLNENSAAIAPEDFSDDECATLPTNLLAGKPFKNIAQALLLIRVLLIRIMYRRCGILRQRGPRPPSPMEH
jgi:hypothetical protein